MISVSQQNGGSSTVPPIVYHYTSAETLLKIVDSQMVWATNLRYLNDATESDHCLRVMKRRLPEFLERYRPQYGADLETALHQMDDEIWEAPYVASFSANSDSLPQWRSYCHNGNGVSIGFRTEMLRQSRISKEPKMMGKVPAHKSTINSILYLEESDNDTIDEVLNSCLSELKSWHEEQEATDPKERTSASDDRVLESIVKRWACLVKHSGFANEMEQRLVAPPDFLAGDVLRYRSSRTTVVPYLEVRMPEWGIVKQGPPKYAPTYSDYFIAQVIVGPTPNPELTASALGQLFRRKQVPVTIRNSNIPYRDL